MQQNLPKQGGFLNQKRWVIGILFFLFAFLTFSIGLIITSQTTLQKVNRSKESTENLKVIVSNLYDSTQIKQLLETTAANTVTEQSGVYLENTILGTKKVFYTDVLFIPETEKMFQNKKQNEKKNQITLPYIFYTRYGVKKKDNIKLYVKDKSMEFVVRGFYEDDCYGVQAVNDLVVAYIRTPGV